MKFSQSVLPLAALLLCLPAMFVVPAMASTNGLMLVSQQRRMDAPDAVDLVAAYRAPQRGTVRQEAAAAGRRLTAAELANLRDQVRQQWSVRSEAVRSAASQPVKSMVVTAELRAAAVPAVPAPRSQRP